MVLFEPGGPETDSVMKNQLYIRVRKDKMGLMPKRIA